VSETAEVLGCGLLPNAQSAMRQMSKRFYRIGLRVRVPGVASRLRNAPTGSQRRGGASDDATDAAASGGAPEKVKLAPAVRSLHDVVLHLRGRYVSKAAIFAVPAFLCRPKIEVPLELQGLGSLGADTCGDGFSLASLTANKERVCGCRKSARFGSVRPLCNGLV
jgi:hypothetical protein